MRVLRSSLYTNPAEPPLTTVHRDSDVIDSLESIRASLVQPGALVIHEIFDMPDGGIEDATMTAMNHQRANAEEEANQALLYYWSVLEYISLEHLSYEPEED